MIFTNEDGGTPTDRLMATWGRTTDIEYIYSVEVDAPAASSARTIQGPEHEIAAVTAAQREGRHPLLWVSTDNNMVLDAGDVAGPLRAGADGVPISTDVSREAVMDANPWLYAVMAQELRREGRSSPTRRPATDTIPDPRRFVYLEGCGEVGDRAALAFARARRMASWPGTPPIAGMRRTASLATAASAARRRCRAIAR